ncbi:hypothetical protein H8959_002771 [Pygathrix nigripes]
MLPWRGGCPPAELQLPMVPTTEEVAARKDGSPCRAGEANLQPQVKGSREPPLRAETPTFGPSPTFLRGPQPRAFRAPLPPEALTRPRGPRGPPALDRPRPRPGKPRHSAPAPETASGRAVRPLRPPLPSPFAARRRHRREEAEPGPHPARTSRSLTAAWGQSGPGRPWIPPRPPLPGARLYFRFRGRGRGHIRVPARSLPSPSPSPSCVPAPKSPGGPPAAGETRARRVTSLQSAQTRK